MSETHAMYLDKEKDKEIASAAMALLLAALTVTVISPLLLFVAYLFHFSIGPR